MFIYLQESFTAAQKLREGFLQGASCILTSAPSIGTQFLERKTDKVIIVVSKKLFPTETPVLLKCVGIKGCELTLNTKLIIHFAGRNNQDKHYGLWAMGYGLWAMDGPSEKPGRVQLGSRLALTHDSKLAKVSFYLVDKCFSLLSFRVVWDY